MTSFGYRLNPRYAIKECSSCGTLYTRDCSCSKGSVEDKILVPKPHKNCARCGHPVNGSYCQGCTLLREKLEEDLVTYFQNFQNTFESSDDNTNVVNAPREPFVVKQDHGVNPPHIDECCCECGEALDGIICQQCACKSCGKCAHIGYNCPPKVPIIFNPEPCNRTMNNEPPQILPSFDPMCYSKNSSPCVSKPISVEESPNVFNPPPQPPIYSCEFYESNAQYGHYCTPQVPLIYPERVIVKTLISRKILTIFNNSISIVISVEARTRLLNVLLLAWDRVFKIKDALGNKQYKLEDIQELFRELLNDVQNIHEELAEFINSPGWNRPAEPDNSLSMRDEHLDTIPTTESDEVIKSSVENLVSIPSEFKGIPDTMCDVHLVNNPTPLEAKDHFEIVINSNDDYSSSDDDSLYYENIEYVEASPHDFELVSLEVEKIVIPEDEKIEDDNLHEKLLKVNLLIAKIEALKDNPTPSSEFLTKSSSTSSKSFLEETNTFHNSLPEFENFYFDLEEIRSGSTTTHYVISLPDYEAFSLTIILMRLVFPPTDRSDFTHEEFGNEPAHIISPPKYDCFYFRNLPDSVEDDYSPLLAYVVWIFLAYLTYPVIPPHLHLFENEDTIFDPGITINRFYLFKPGLSHRCGTFKKFNTHRSHLYESPMEMLFSTLFPMDQ
uniref:Uncharacterized protein n=1 Tax=Tanacetum cinerariifolium TaxID=118510 RepID=A0A699JEH1_TANCI|nr:hypothetical protein [Tanacetum cinerariifolium]